MAGTIYTEPPDCGWKLELRRSLNPSSFFYPFPENDKQRGITFPNPIEPDKYDFFDPDPQNEPELYMVARDKAEISKCDIFVAYIQRPTIGTVMEFMYASLLQTKAIFIINPSGSLINDLWVRAHAHLICASVNECAEHIKTMRF